MIKQFKYSNDAQLKLISGVNQLAKAVVVTLGPKGKNVAIDKQYGAPVVVHDGVTVAKEIELKDRFENMGAQLVKEAASKTNDVAGDGTTTATIIAREIVKEGYAAINEGFDPMVLKSEIDSGVQVVLKALDTIKKPIQGSDIVKVATISAQNTAIGSKIAEALNRVGKNGVVTVEDGRGLDLEIEYKEGMEFDKGYASAYFVTNTERMEAEIDNPYILITDKKISAINDLVPFLETFVKVSKNLVLIADEIDGEALALMVVNKLKGLLNVVAIKAPGFGDRRKAMLEDIAILTGGTVISDDTGRKFDNVTVDDCGRADKVWADKESARIVGGKGTKAAVQARIDQIRREIEETKSDYDKEHLEKRLAKLTGGVAVINVGAATEVELKEKKERVIDAVAATKAALDEGVVPGGGIALLRVREALVTGGASLEKKGAKRPVAEYNEFRNRGWGVLYHALTAPLKGILTNARGDQTWVNETVQRIRYHQDKQGEVIPVSSQKHSYGFDVLTMEFGDMIEKGIIDPAKVTRLALLNGASVGSMILTTNALITDLPENKEGSAGGGMPPGMGGMGGMGGMY